MTPTLYPYYITVKFGRETFAWVRFAPSAEGAREAVLPVIEEEFHGRGRLVSVSPAIVAGYATEGE